MSLWINSRDLIVDTVGNKYNDSYSTDSIYGKVKTLLEHVHEHGKCYPNLSDAITITGGVAGWALGSFVEIVPSDTITSPFDIHWIYTSSGSVSDEYQVNLYEGTLGNEVLICEVPVSRDAAQSGTITARVMTLIQAANTRISAKMASKSGGSDTIKIKILYHEY